MVNQNRHLAALLSAPGLTSTEDLPMLQDLLEQYPYMQPLHLLMARVSGSEAEDLMATAALYTNGAALHKFMNSAENTHVSIEPLPAWIDEEEEDIFEEIEEVNIGQYKDVPQAVAEVPHVSERKDLDEFGIENIVATDFFAFENRFSGALKTMVAEDEMPTDDARVTKYDDDKLPYTFLWWLAKTRKEYQQIFQPYVTRKAAPAGSVQTATGTGLQQQYIEHIFHIQTPFSAEEHLAPDVEHLQASGKGKEIIENFIKKDPQIQTPKPEQIDNENKAKKSAEDHNDLVSETLAKIYIEQMLYHKAIETYEKLSLKFPEKSRYFADLIQSINKKI